MDHNISFEEEKKRNWRYVGWYILWAVLILVAVITASRPMYAEGKEIEEDWARTLFEAVQQGEGDFVMLLANPEMDPEDYFRRDFDDWMDFEIEPDEIENWADEYFFMIAVDYNIWNLIRWKIDPETEFLEELIEEELDEGHDEGLNIGDGEFYTWTKVYGNGEYLYILSAVQQGTDPDREAIYRVFDDFEALVEESKKETSSDMESAVDDSWIIGMFEAANEFYATCDYGFVLACQDQDPTDCALFNKDKEEYIEYTLIRQHVMEGFLETNPDEAVCWQMNRMRLRDITTRQQVLESVLQEYEQMGWMDIGDYCRTRFFVLADNIYALSGVATESKDAVVVDRGLNEFTAYMEANVPSAVYMEAGISGIVITVRRGDCLWNLARDYYGEGGHWQEIYDRNRGVIGEDPSFIQVGMELALP